MTPFVSRTVRLGVLGQLAANFNAALAQAGDDAGVPGFAYYINFDGSSDRQNFYQGDRTLESLSTHQEPDLPALTFWTGEGQPYGPGQREMPSAWSGVVAVYFRFFLFVPGVRASGLVDMRETTEAALISVLAQDVQGLRYMGDLGWQALNEQQLYDVEDQFVGWVQEVTYQAHFEVTI